MSKILIVDDDQAICRTLQIHFEDEGYQVQLAHNVQQGLDKAQHFQPQLIILDIRLGGLTGLEGLPKFKAQLPHSRIIMITAFHDMESTIEAMQKGADEYIHKPIDLDQLDEAVTKSFTYSYHNQHQHHDAVEINNKKPQFMVGSSRAMCDIYKTIGRVAKTSASVLITGDSGTGKEMVAKALHKASFPETAPFIAVNCAALVDTLLESEMFGHRKGAFTGANQDQLGKFQLAQNGTLFLDEVGELSPTLQAKLLRVLQEKEFTPLGAKEAIKTNARVITATNIDFEKALDDKKFREDLYYRLQVVNIHIPPLQQHREDIPELVHALLNKSNRELETNVKRISNDVMQALQNHTWPGNVRELENCLTKAVAICPSELLTLDLFIDTLNLATDKSVTNNHFNLQQSLQDIEKVHVSRVLKDVQWHRGKACEVLGVSRPRLQRLIVQYDLEKQ
jgi:DNA-binding NtrC family response regulator